MLIIASTENAERVLACMSACKGIPTESLKEPGYWRRLSREFTRQSQEIEQLKKEIDGYRLDLTYIATDLGWSRGMFESCRRIARDSLRPLKERSR